ncbi:hypothetical protein GlitD10_1594 [Gloeomargarita lithophora Alchichica-D10]|uniref:DUF4394 domain-containing protein n=1 Tax=Gloeomargarita lithophora Alchichica-D10 TaxID=1188229 RepID=A0A1J0AD96_9CYAN|nr:DUF4394 domain-containing protein [Gloeomargarita lithophora]APB33918.1 hypothetical protein GlitD10_1594 [Gloeomargarita lithophora Alchichica-D10]
MNVRQWLATMIGVAGLATAILNATAKSPMPGNLLGLTGDNHLVAFVPNSQQPRRIPIQGVEGRVIGIDVRPANGLLYALTNTDKIYTLDPRTGAGQLVSTLSMPFQGNVGTGMDFNPVPDRLRLVDRRGNNFRINVDTGMVTADQPLNYAPQDVHATMKPQVTAAAYTNAFPGPPATPHVTPPTRTTQLFNIDTNLDVLVLQNPPNDGTLTTIGSLGVNLEPAGEFDIFSPQPGVNLAYAVSGSMVYSIDLGSGAATRVGNLGSGMNLIGLTFLPTP